MSAAVVYRMHDANGGLLYVGCTIKWTTRISAHRGKNWHDDVANITLEHFASHEDALTAEVAAIQSEAPKHNVRQTRGRTPASWEIHKERKAAEAADRRERGVYHVDGLRCHNCSERVTELPRGLSRAEAQCPNCDCPVVRPRSAA